MNHYYENNPKCPHCNTEQDNLNFGIFTGSYACETCEKEFLIESNVDITYNTVKVNCIDLEQEHDHVPTSCYVKDQSFNQLNPILYVKIETCLNCDDERQLQITAEEYQKLKKHGC